MNQKDFLLQYFIRNPKRDIDHPEIVDWVTTEYKKVTGNVFRDPDRAIRRLAQDGKLIKIGKGTYRYDPDFIKNPKLEDFTPQQKELIFKRDNFRCVICGRGKREGVEIHADHVKPKDRGGRATVENGQTLCGQHNYQKKNYGQTEFGKKYFIRVYQTTLEGRDREINNFAKEILEIYEKRGVDSHIKWKK